MWRFQFRHAGRRSRFDFEDSQAWLSNRIRRKRDRLDRSAGDIANAGTAKIPLGLRHASMSLETRRRAFPSTLWRAGIRRHDERLDLPDHFPVDLADHGFDFDLHVAFELARSFAATRRIFIHEFAASA